MSSVSPDTSQDAVVPNPGGESSEPRITVIGAGPGGLTAAYELARQGVRCTVFESGSKPGGLARTEVYKGYRFDIGGHRFYSKVGLVEKLWKDWLGDDLLERPRLSRIYYRGTFFKYPLEPWDALRGLGLGTAITCLASYLFAQIHPVRPERTFDAWVSNRFGRRLFKIFFESYTEKVWGVPCSQIDAEWAAQRIRGLNVISLLKHMLMPGPRSGGKVVKTLIGSFRYPRLGPGMMWERCADKVRECGSQIFYQSRVQRILWEPGRVTAVDTGNGPATLSHLISTMAIRDLASALDPPPPPSVAQAAARLRYRDFITVVLVLDAPEVFPDNWIYVHDQRVKVGRIQNYKNWSPEMVPDSSHTCLGLEYFCQEDDGLWSSADAELIKLASRELQSLGIASSEKVIDGTVVRAPKAYPVYDSTYREALQEIRNFLGQLSNLQLVGRNGMHRYNNQDHSMLTGLLAARNAMGGSYDLWKINAEADYLEEGFTREELAELEASQPRVPQPAKQNVAGAL